MKPYKVALLIIAAILVIAALWLLPVDEWVKYLTAAVQELGALGIVIYILVYALMTILLLPASPLTLAAGLVYGVGVGFAVVLAGATLGALAAFLIARYAARDWAAAKLENWPRFKAIDGAIAHESWKVVLLTRLSPLMPFSLQNFFYGVTDIRFLDYAWATFIGIMPGTLLYVYLGAAGNAAADDSTTTLQWVLFGVGLLATLVVAVLIGRKAKARLLALTDDQAESEA